MPFTPINPAVAARWARQDIELLRHQAREPVLGCKVGCRSREVHLMERQKRKRNMEVGKLRKARHQFSYCKCSAANVWAISWLRFEMDKFIESKRAFLILFLPSCDSPFAMRYCSCLRFWAAPATLPFFEAMKEVRNALFTETPPAAQAPNHLVFASQDPMIIQWDQRKSTGPVGCTATA